MKLLVGRTPSRNRIRWLGCVSAGNLEIFFFKGTLLTGFLFFFVFFVVPSRSSSLDLRPIVHDSRCAMDISRN